MRLLLGYLEPLLITVMVETARPQRLAALASLTQAVAAAVAEPEERLEREAQAAGQTELPNTLKRQRMRLLI